jgi:apolipoprotein N-acyltransferase
MILSMTTGLATGVIRISFNGLGPTEARLAIIAGTLWGIYMPIPRFTWMGQSLTVYDALFLIAAGAMIVMSIIEAVRTLRKLAVEDPPYR